VVKEKTPEKLTIIIDTKQPIAKYLDWDLFIDLEAKPKYQAYSHEEIPGLFTGKRSIDGKVVIEVKGATIKSLIKKMDTERKSSAKFRNKCKTLLVDVKKCDYCADRFICFTEK